MISYQCLTRIYYSRRNREQDLLTNSSTELYVPLWTHINILFFPRTIPEWNLLHPDTVNSETIDQFKSRLLPPPSSSLRPSSRLAASVQLAPVLRVAVPPPPHPPTPPPPPTPTPTPTPHPPHPHPPTPPPPPPHPPSLHLEVIRNPQDKTRQVSGSSDQIPPERATPRFMKMLSNSNSNSKMIY